MARLPVPGSDTNAWGTILNDYLSVEHNADGTLKAGGSLAAKADASRLIATSTGLSGGGDLSANRTLSVVNDTTTQRVRVGKAGIVAGTRPEINFVEGSNITLTTSDDSANNRVNVTVAAASVSAYQPIVRSAYITSGDVIPADSGGAWTVMSGFELQIPAVVGEWVQLEITHMILSASTAKYDVGVIVGSTVKRYLSSGTATPAVDGDPSWYFDSGYTRARGAKGFTVTSNDLDGSNVRFVMLYKTTAAAGTVFASTNYPFYWQAINLRVVG